MFFPTDEGVILDTPEDITASRKIAFELGAKYHIKQRHEALGGCSVNVAVGLVKLGFDVSCYACVGSDMVGKWIMEEIGSCGVNSSSILAIPGTPSDLSAIVVDESSGERTIFSSHGASLSFKAEKDIIGTPEWIFIGDLSGDWRGNLETIIEKAKNEDISIVFNPRQQMIHEDPDFVYDVIGMSEIALLNKDEAIEIVMKSSKVVSSEGLDQEHILINEFMKTGVRYIVITDGIRGAWASDGLKTFHVDALRHDESVVDTTGAGDAFASGFIGAVLNGKELQEAAAWGIANSSNSTKFYGGQAGLLKKDEIDKNSRSVKLKEL
jgi:ribokinase